MAGTFVISGVTGISVKSAPTPQWGGGNLPADITRPTGDSALLLAINSAVQEGPSLYAGYVTGGPVSVVGTWLIRFSMALNDAIIALDGAAPISWVSLPAGVVPLTATLKITVAQPSSLNGDAAGSLAFQTNALVQSDNLVQRVSHTPVVKSFNYTGDLTFLDLIADGFGIVCAFVTPGTIGQEFYNAQITGTYEIQSNSQLQPVLEPFTGYPGNKVKITAPSGLDGVEQVVLSYPGHEIVLNIDDQTPYMTIDGVYYYWLNWIILQQSAQFWFYLPFGFGRYSGPVSVVLIGNGVQFTGSVAAGILNVLFADVSGIYALDDDQTNDILYFRTGYSSSNKLIMLQDITNDEVYETDFFWLLGYPYRILGLNLAEEADEDVEISDFSRIANPQLVAVPTSVEIPSPFIKTAYLP